MDFIRKNNFIVNHGGAKYFEKDFELFKRLFPDSPIINSLAKANQYNKKNLDERMLLEILNVVCEEEVLDNRGSKAKAKKAAKKKQMAKVSTKKASPQKKSGGRAKNTRQ